MTPGPTTTTARAATVGTEKGEVHRRCSSDQPREATFDLRSCWSKVSFTLHDLEQARTGDRTASLLRGQDMEGAGWGRMPSDKSGDGGSDRAVPQLLPSYLLYAMLAVTLVVLTSSELLSSEGEGLPSRLLLRRSTASAVRAAGNPANNADRNAVQPGKLSLPPVVIASADNDNTYFMASPSITKLPDGSLLAVYEKQPFGSKLEPKINYRKNVRKSSDGGKTWATVARVESMLWPQLINCKSGFYIMGAQDVFGGDNNIVVSKMLTPDGTQWSEAVPVTKHRSIMFGNTGVDVSRGYVTKAFEDVPTLAAGNRHNTGLTRDLHVEVHRLVDKTEQAALPEVVAHVVHPDNFAKGELVKINCTNPEIIYDTGALRGLGVNGSHLVLFFRVTSVNAAAGRLYLRPEKYNAYFFQGDFVIPKRTRVKIASGSVMYGDQDFRSVAIQAPDTADLTDPASWVESNPVGNPASVYRTALKELLGMGHLTNNRSREMILEHDPVLLERLSHVPAEEVQNDFGNLYALEGVVTRMQDRRGGDGSLQILLRVNNNVNCNLGAIVTVKDSQTWNSSLAPGQLQSEFQRYTFAPGAGIAHPAVLYDEVADIYWYVNNVARDSQAPWKQVGHKLHISKNSICEVDRTSLGLFYSANAVDWVFAGFVDYHLDYMNHFSYPQMIIDEEDLLVVTRATLPSGPRGAGSKMYNNHNSNSIAFHRVPNFRSHAPLDWLTHKSQFSRRPWNTPKQNSSEVGV